MSIPLGDRGPSLQRLNEDENHVLFVCPLYKSSREEFLSHITVSFEQLQNCDYKLREFMSFHFYNIAKFLNKAMLLRDTVLKSRQKIQLIYYETITL